MAELTELQKYEFRRSLEEVKKLQGRGTELISLYIPPTRQISDVANYLKGEYSQSSNIKSASTRKNVQGAISSILSRLKNFKQPPENGLVFFVGHRAIGADQTNMIQFCLEPPDPVPTFIYRCDSAFFTEPIEAMLTTKESYGLIVIDRGEATIGFLHGKRIVSVKNIQSLVPSKHGRGGQSARRFERSIEIAAHEYYKKVAGIANEAFLSQKNLKGVLIGGPGPTKDFFAKSEYLHYELQKKIVDTFDVGYTDEYGLKELDGLIEYGASPRATIYLAQAAKANAFLRRRGYVTPEDVKQIGMDVLRHRVLLTYEAEAEEMTSEDIIKKVFERVEVP